ncbi:uncharacterized protein METZ01_LOCUS331571, partial [marine metagenome]
RNWNDPRLRYGRLRRPGCRQSSWDLQTAGKYPSRRRYSANRLAEKWKSANDRTSNKKLYRHYRNTDRIMTSSKPDTQVITFGCRLNYYESSIIRRHAELFSNQNIVVVNTCAVTAEAERQARQAIRRARRELPGSKIIVTGCSAQITPDVYYNMEEVDAVVGNKEKLTAELFQEDGKAVNVGNIMDEHEVGSEIPQNKDCRARAFVQIQTGCDHRCTFCIIPYGRGNSRSIPKEKILREIQSLIGFGYNEVVLTGVDITSYGSDLEPRTHLGTLVKSILNEVSNLRRLRLSSLDPAELDEALWETLATNERLMPHLHLSVQAGHDLILKRMKRRHSR